MTILMIDATQIRPSRPKDKTAFGNIPFYGAKDQAAAHAVGLWLMIMCGFVALMVTIGGATRLTDSGLSITQWDLLMGALPPMSAEDWQEAFALYRQIPEYSQVNLGMSLAEFKSIYWWEWGHRNFGRFIGLAFIGPLVWFWAKGALGTTGLKLRLVTLFLLICGQGALGWYMVSSGLSERVDVSQYRLAMHLGLAVILFALMFWMALHLRGIPIPAKEVPGRAKLFRLSKIFAGFVFLQIILGAFVAGLRAGKTYTDWPLMDGAFIPSAYFADKPGLMQAFETVALVQFNHRIGAYFLMAFAIAFWLVMRRVGAPFERYARYAMLAVLAQAVLGIWTLVTAVPIMLGLAHQLGALAVLALVLLTLYKVQPPHQQ